MIIVANSLPYSESRRGFMKQILALGVAPAIVKLANIMPVRAVVPASMLDAERVIGQRLDLVGKVWTTDEIRLFYHAGQLTRVWARPLSPMEREKRDVIEQDIFKAQKEGRIKQSGHNNYFKERWGFQRHDLWALPIDK